MNRLTTIIPDPTGNVVVTFDPGPPETVSWTGKLAVDSDGKGDPHGDPCQQPDTSLHVAGKPLDADVDRYIVVPPIVIQQTAGIVLGCRGIAVNIKTGVKVEVVAGDIGPHRKIGEGSCATAKALGLNPSPTRGGTDDHIIQITLYPGQPAPGYQLQAS